MRLLQKSRAPQAPEGPLLQRPFCFAEMWDFWKLKIFCSEMRLPRYTDEDAEAAGTAGSCRMFIKISDRKVGTKYGS